MAGVPTQYEPGEKYRLSVTVGRPGLGAAGFQMSARYLEGEARGRDAGLLRPADARTAVVRAESTRVSYAQHVEAGTVPVHGDSTSWSIEWTAPDGASDAVAFDIAANAADGDASEFGDRIYATRCVAAAPDPRSD